MRMVAGFFLGMATMLVLNTPKGREVVEEVGKVIADGAMQKLGELKNELLPAKENHHD